jgi:hypothetical protein
MDLVLDQGMVLSMKVKPKSAWEEGVVTYFQALQHHKPT